MWLENYNGKVTDKTYKEAAEAAGKYAAFFDGGPFDEDDLDKVIYGMEWMLTYMYGLDIDDEHPHRDIWSEYKKWKDEFRKKPSLMNIFVGADGDEYVDEW